MSTHDLPLLALFDEDQGGSTVDCLDLAVFGHSGKRVVSVDDPCVVVKDTARWLAEAKAHGGNAFGCSGQEIGELGFIVKSVIRRTMVIEVTGAFRKLGLLLAVRPCMLG